MRTYEVDELPAKAIERVVRKLNDSGLAASLEGLFWLPLPRELLTAEQLEHFDLCGPYCLSLDCGHDQLRLELLVRAMNKLHCSCIAYATAEQRAYIIDFLDTLLRELDIPV